MPVQAICVCERVYTGIHNLLDQFVTDAQIYSTKLWCQYVHRFLNLAVQYHVNKPSFGRKFTVNGNYGFWISNKSYQEMQKVSRTAYNIVTIVSIFYLFWSCELSAKVDCTVKLKCQLNYTRLCMTPHSVELMFFRWFYYCLHENDHWF